MDKRQTKTDWESGQPRTGAFGGCANDYIKEEERGNHLGEEARDQVELARAKVAISVGCEPVGHPVGFARRNCIKHSGGRYATSDLGDDIGENVTALKAAP